MLDNLPRARSPELDRAFRDLVQEEAAFVQQERRAVYRQPFFRPLLVQLPGTTERALDAFSKNLSPLGIGIVSPRHFQLGQVATIDIPRLDRPPLVVLCECRWVDPFFAQWQFSGWAFLNLERA